jgi:hypothetical protein
MTNTPPRRIVVFWLAHFTGRPDRKGWDTKLVHPRYKDFDDADKARKLVATLTACQENNEPYCSRYVSHITTNGL